MIIFGAMFEGSTTLKGVGLVDETVTCDGIGMLVEFTGTAIVVVAGG